MIGLSALYILLVILSYNNLGTVSREYMGITRNWSYVKEWISSEPVFEVSSTDKSQVLKLKCPEIEILKDYRAPPPEAFWKKFPKKDIPSKAESSVKWQILASEIMKRKSVLSSMSYRRGMRAVSYLRTGASSHQKEPPLTNVVVKNSETAYTYGKEVTDSIAHWIKSGFASGPFNHPPLDNFRVNSIAALPQDGKARTILNVSLPKDKSFNDNIDVNMLEKIKMSSARNFGFTLRECGPGARFGKSDIKDAYKNIPVPPSEHRLQGFNWLGKYFIEDRQIFGSRAAPANFDCLNHILVDMAIKDCKINPELVHRHLDDVPVAGPKNSGLSENFANAYKNICETVGLGLAEECPKKEKAFRDSSSGKVLGVIFNSSDMTWRLPSDKVDDILLGSKAAQEDNIKITDLQSLMGRLNNLAMMAPFLNAFRWNLNRDLATAEREKKEVLALSSDSKNDLKVWVSLLLHTHNKGLPIPSRPTPPVLYRKDFFSDAAGKSGDLTDKPGVASIGLDENGEICFAKRIFWEKGLLERADNYQKKFGHKTALLEFVGILLPVISSPHMFRKSQVVMHVDNTACIHGWNSRGLKNDPYTSILIRGLHLIGHFLETDFHFRHLPRLSSWEAELVDRMSRQRTTTSQDRGLLDSFNIGLPKEFMTWIANPQEDWSFAVTLLNCVESLMK